MAGGKFSRYLLSALGVAMILGAIFLLAGFSRHRDIETPVAAAVDDDGCLTCHGDPSFEPKTSARPWDQLYTDPAVIAASTHGSITCRSCHKTFDTGTPLDERDVQSVCGSCHEREQRLQESTVHSDPTVTNCLSCHSSSGSGHDVQPVLSPTSSVFVKNVPKTCGSCHADRELMAEYGLSADVPEVYMDGPHGKVIKLTGADGDGLQPATCVSCHGSHEVHAVDDPQSAVKDKDSRAQLCATCHDGANGNFAGSLPIHSQPTPGGTPSLFYGERFFFMLTASVVAFGVLVVVLAGFGWLYRRAGDPVAALGFVVMPTSGGAAPAVLGVFPGAASLPAPAAPGAAVRAQAVPWEIERFDPHQRVQHLIMMTTFLLLALTGLPQKFPDWEMSRWLIQAWGGLDSARTIHRFAGLTMMADCAYHLGYIAFMTIVRGKQPPIAMIPTPKDVLHFFQHLRYWFGRSTEKPRFGRFSYLEKFDYWAIFWGMPVIGLSGLVLMFPMLVTKILPGNVVSVALLAHSDEAILAVAWIFLVHFFFVHINPRFFPLNRSIFTGKLPRDVYAEEHPVELEQRQRGRYLN